MQLLSRSFKDSWIWFLTCLLDGGNGHLLSRSLTTDFVWGAFMLTPTSCARSKALKDAMHKDKSLRIRWRRLKQFIDVIAHVLLRKLDPATTRSSCLWILSKAL